MRYFPLLSSTGCGLDESVIYLLNTYKQDEDLQKECLISIGSLAYRSETRKVRLIELGAPIGMCVSLKTHADCEAVLEEGLWASGYKTIPFIFVVPLVSL